MSLPPNFANITILSKTTPIFTDLVQKSTGLCNHKINHFTPNAQGHYTSTTEIVLQNSVEEDGDNVKFPLIRNAEIVIASNLDVKIPT